MFFKKKSKLPDTVNSAVGIETVMSQIKNFVQRHFALPDETLFNVALHKRIITVSLPFPCEKDAEQLASQLCDTIALPSDLTCKFVSNIPMFATKQPLVRNVKNIVAVSSGKGGVGKSATAVNLALALSKLGARVGVLDADIYGPSVPLMLGTTNKSPDTEDNKTMQPIYAHKLVSNSIGYLVDNEHASIWRGPMASKALQQLINETEWPLLDYLIVDMPPGTGDIQLTMAQQIPLTAAVVVTTPQDIALADAGKGIAMYEKLSIPVLGLIENMSYFECPNCATQSPIFSTDGASKLAKRYHLPVLAEVPIDMHIRQNADNGKSLFDDKNCVGLQNIYLQAARQMSINMANNVALSDVAKAANVGIDITRLD
ncbi:iron-sulfur cluster carrier protein ApbC [Agaribacter flavus]|uniref:Iron-sulfur cluster carrier protein n=1 Tax=Agaribacter flavus TaxID=1902781 RepID=A0ABV7FLU6_9ALTE